MNETSPIDTVLAAVARHTAAVDDAAADLDLTQPSLCTGWTRAHIIAHLGHNAEGLLRLVRAACDDSGETMYAGVADRDADIDRSAQLPPDELRAFARDQGAALVAALPRLAAADPAREVERVPGGPTFQAGNLPSMRLRELIYHHVDLDAGFGFADVEPALLRRLWEQEIGMVDTSDPAALGTALTRLARGMDPR